MTLRPFIALIFALCLTSPLLAVTPEEVEKIHKQATPSLVAVQYTWEHELGRQEFVGAGLIVKADGLVMTSIALTPPGLPDAQMKEFKVIIPGDEQTELDAEFAGRDERSGVSFFRIKSADAADAKAAPKFTPVTFEDVPTAVGQDVISVGLLPKTASYQSFVTRTSVSAKLRGETPMFLVGAEGLAGVGAPVFNPKGQAIGWVVYQQRQNVLLNDTDPRTQLQTIYVPARMFVPASEILPSFQDLPIAGQPIKYPWLGIAAMTGLKKEVADFFGLKNQTAIQVGDVIKETPADKAGLKAGNIIVKMNGQPLERGDEPDEAAFILMKKVKRMKPGEEVTFSVISEPNKPAADVKLTLTERPKQENQAKRFYAEDLGFGARDVVFDDTYRRKLQADQKGVVVAIIKPSSAAQAGKLERGDLVTKMNGAAVTDVEQLKKAYQDLRKEKPREAIVLEAIRQGADEIIRIEPPQ